MHRPLEHHRVPRRPAPLRRARRSGSPTRPTTRARARREQPVQQAQQHALAGAVRADDERRRAGLDREGDAAEDRDPVGRVAQALRAERQAGAGRAHRISRRPPAHRAAVSRAACASAFTVSTTAISTMPSASASGRSPLLVSSAMAVVITRVKPSMLPPTTITAPTSALARPKPASSTVSRAKRPSQSRVGTARHGPGAEGAELLGVLLPQRLQHLPRQRGEDRRDQHRLRDHHRGRREQQTEPPERPGARQQQVDQQPRHHRRQAHQRVQRHHHAAPAGKARHRQQRPERQPDQGGDRHRRQAHARATARRWAPAPGRRPRPGRARSRSAAPRSFTMNLRKAGQR